MAQTVLTPEQRKLLDVISKDKFVTTHFFLTGGTALSEFYFQHRFSEDLDFFSEGEFNSNQLLVSISAISKSLKLVKVEQQRLTGQEVFFVYFTDKKFVKTDFAYFPFSHLGSFKKINDLKITSIEDICVNKVHAITTRKRARDYLDLYLCLKSLKWLPEDLIKNYRLKFDVNLSSEQLATSFTNVVDAQDQPIFMGQNNWEEIKDYFLKLAVSLKNKVIH